MELYTFKPTYLFLEEIRKNDSLRSYFSTEFEPISVDLESFHKNANCSCKNRIVAYLSQNVNSEKMQVVLSNLSETEYVTKVQLSDILTIEQVKASVQKTASKPLIPKMGEVILLHTTNNSTSISQDWKNLMDLSKSENWNYKGITLYTEGDKVYALFY